jgi:hypothetical protein
VQRWQAACAERGAPRPLSPPLGPAPRVRTPVQRQPARAVRRVPIQRLISKDAWITFSGVDIKDTPKSKKNKQQVDPEKEAFKTIADLVGQYEATKDAPKNETTRAEQFKILYGIEHTIYGLFEIAPDRGNNSSWKKVVYWLLDNVQEEYTRKIAEPGKYYAKDQNNLSKKQDEKLQKLWGKIKDTQQGQTTFKITNKENASNPNSPQHEGFDTEIYAAFGRLISMPKGRELVSKLVKEIGGDAQRTIDISPLPQKKAEQGVIAETASYDEAVATGQSKDENAKGPGTMMKMPSGYRDTDVRSYTKPTKGDDLGPKYEALAPFYIILGHELIHALHNLQKENKKKTIYEKDSKDSVYENLEEKNTILGTGNDEDISESDLRSEHDLFATRYAHTHTNKSEDPTTVKRSDRIKERWKQSVRAFKLEAARKIQDFIPSTKTGMFDAKLTPSTGALDITVKIHLDLQAIQTPKYNESWSKNEANTWMDKLKYGITGAWNGKAQFKLHNPEKPNTTMTVTPAFHVVSSYTIDSPTKPNTVKTPPVNPKTGGETAKAGPNTAHFNMKTYRGALSDYKEPGFEFQGDDPNKALVRKANTETHVHSDPIVAYTGQGRPQGTGAFHGPDVNFMDHNVNLMDFISTDEKMLFKRLLGDTGLELKYKSKFRKPTTIAQETTAKLDQFAEQCKSIYPPPVVKFPLLVKGKNKKHSQLVIDYLKLKPSVVNRLSFEKSKDKVLSVDPVYKATPQDNVGSQLTAAHEFGHMLGLPDDYVRLQGQASAKQETYKYQDPTKGLDIALDKDLKESLEAGAKSGGPTFTPAMQKGLLDLAEKANVPVPTTFGLKTDTMMGSGDKILPHHFVTVWEALTQLTKDYFPAQFWKIETG